MNVPAVIETRNAFIDVHRKLKVQKKKYILRLRTHLVLELKMI